MNLLAIICPPLAVLLTGRILGFIISIPLTFLGWVPGILYANSCVADNRRRKDHQAQMRQFQNTQIQGHQNTAALQQQMAFQHQQQMLAQQALLYQQAALAPSARTNTPPPIPPAIETEDVTDI